MLGEGCIVDNASEDHPAGSVPLNVFCVAGRCLWCVAVERREKKESKQSRLQNTLDMLGVTLCDSSVATASTHAIPLILQHASDTAVLGSVRSAESELKEI